MRPILPTAICAVICFGLSPAAQAYVTYEFSTPQVTGAPGMTTNSITVTSAAVASGFLAFDRSCLTTLPACGSDPSEFDGWVSGFGFPTAPSVAYVNLQFLPGGLLSGSIHVAWELTDLAFTYQGDGTNWTATCFDGPEALTGTGFYLAAGDPPDPVTEPAALSLLGIGLAGLVAARRSRAD